MLVSRGGGRGSGVGMGGGYGRNRTNMGLGPSGICVCPKCGTEVSHKRGVPCYEMKCPECRSTLTRKELNSSNYRGGMASTARKEEVYPYPVIDKEKCVACGICIDACPFDAIEIKNGSAEIIEKKCQKCNKCISTCPKDAIKI